MQYNEIPYDSKKCYGLTYYLNRTYLLDSYLDVKVGYRELGKYSLITRYKRGAFEVDKSWVEIWLAPLSLSVPASHNTHSYTRETTQPLTENFLVQILKRTIPKYSSLSDRNLCKKDNETMLSVTDPCWSWTNTLLNVVIYLILPSQAPVDIGLVFGTQWGRIGQARCGLLDTVVNIFEIVCTHIWCYLKGPERFTSMSLSVKLDPSK